MNQDTAAGKFDQIKGKVKQSVGEAVGNEKLANSGIADQVKGAVKETWGNVKDAAHSVADDAHARAEAKHVEGEQHASESAQDLRDKVSTGTQNAKNAVSAKLDEIKKEHQRSA